VPVIEEEKLRNLMLFYARLTSLFGSVAKEAYNYKLMADTLAHRTAELEYVNGELESFSYSVSHDLRAPLRHITGYVDLFNRRNRDELSPQGAHYFDAIRDSAEEMGCLIDDLLHYSRNGRAELIRAPIDMNTIVTDLVRKFSDSHPGRNVVWHVSHLPAAYADATMIKFVWHNLVDNALKFTNKKDQANIEIGFLSNENAYYIKDNGVGFDMKYANKLFGMFQRLHSKDEFDGTGIGLASVKRIISRHGGRIWAEAETNAGASFFFILPGKD
jgi:light-regulated signal transduction histidine kinase (bacteriophytochrome)